uniref:Uncharacterized protein n=1 Tax=Fundulus heteroclitus TaxID=8078 RepID=A0A3Q2NYB3_FUNHE
MKFHSPTFPSFFSYWLNVLYLICWRSSLSPVSAGVMKLPFISLPSSFFLKIRLQALSINLSIACSNLL